MSVDVLGRVELFQTLSRDDLERLVERGTVRRFAAGAALMLRMLSRRLHSADELVLEMSRSAGNASRGRSRRS